MATTVLLTVPSKTASFISVKNPISKKVVINKTDADELQKLRDAAVRPVDTGENAAQACTNYYDKITTIQNRVPAVNQVQIDFKWQDAFDKGSVFSGRTILVIPFMPYEKACILFNLGAYTSNVVVEQVLSTDSGLQTALKKLQFAAGIFHHLKENIGDVLQQREPTSDLTPDVLGILSELMLAQAQEMIIIKALKDEMKDAVVAKLSSHVQESFGLIQSKMQKDSIKGIWESSWLTNISTKQTFYHGLAHFFQSRVCKAEKAIGEEIARLGIARKSFKRSNDFSNAKDWQKKCESLYEEAKRENDFIYHENIPEEKDLPEIKRAAMAKITPLSEKIGDTY